MGKDSPLVDSRGRISSQRIKRELPLGLGGRSRESLSTWRCRQLKEKQKSSTSAPSKASDPGEGHREDLDQAVSRGREGMREGDKPRKLCLGAGTRLGLVVSTKTGRAGPGNTEMLGIAARNNSVQDVAFTEDTTCKSRNDAF